MSFLLSAVAVLLAVTAVFGFADSRRRYDVIDVFWGPGFGLIALVTLPWSDGDAARRALVTALVLVWGVRLGVHVLVRNLGRPEDRRYAAVFHSTPSSPRSRMYRMYLTQAAVMWTVSLPLQCALHADAPFGPVDAMAALVWAAGFLFEAVGDWQLARFTADPANRGRVLDSGLWRYTRHPNYFGDTVVWWGLFAFALHSWPAALSVAGPLVMTVLLVKVTGKPLLEADIAHRRPEYADYVRRTSGFVPLPPKQGV